MKIYICSIIEFKKQVEVHILNEAHEHTVNVKTSIHASDGAFTDVCTQKYQVIPESL